MKRIYRKTMIGTVLMALFLMGCSNLLEEQPRSIFTPVFFQTQAGVLGGLTSAYASNRYMFGNGYVLNNAQSGTDESTWGQNSDGNVKNNDFSGVGALNATNTNASVIWGTCFPNINTCSGVIENAVKVGTIPASLIAEARFFRAFDYFLLVQTFGGVPLDLGAGRLKFNTTAARISVRDSVTTVYTKAIFPDLLQAINDLPATGRVTGGLTKTAASLILAKAYLTYGWWLENPNNIPTYPYPGLTGARTDPDGHPASWYYQQAYNVATAAIANPGPFGLQPTFYDVNVGTNDRNNEIVLYADHTQSSSTYNGGSLTYSGGGFSTDNFGSWFEQFNYTGVKSSSSNTAWTAVNSVQRASTQALGRPWTMLAPPLGVFYNTFADKTIDSRYDGTFVTVYRANFLEAGLKAQYYGANFLPVAEGSPIISFLKNDTTGVDYSNAVYSSSIGAGVLPTRSDFVISPSNISRICYPGNWKIGPYRTDNTGLGNPNGSSTRPWNISKFSELYFIAAEAAVKGAITNAGQSARDLVNVLRARAGKWRFNNAQNIAQIGDNSAVMTSATPATIDIDYILAERSREYFGEGYRWYDLVRTQKWVQYSSSLTICGATNYSNWNDHTQGTFTRTILPANYLRPIPQSQLDGMDMTAAQKAAYQNPGY